MTFIDLKEIEEVEKIPGYNVRFVHSENMTFAHWRIKASSPLPQHSHPHEQVALVVEGQFEITLEGETRVLLPGMIAVIPENAAHSGRAITDCYLIDTFYPIREDYRREHSP